ncbi:hypothetical protein LTR28_012378, partial [Elasticomyces elasticus]
LGARQYHNGSRLSLAPSEYGAYNNNNGNKFGGMMAGQYPMQQQHAEGGVEMTELVSDDALLAEIREILRTADLMSVTKKSIKLELESRFGVNLDAKRAYIGSATEAVLSGQL